MMTFNMGAPAGVWKTQPSPGFADPGCKTFLPCRICPAPALEEQWLEPICHEY